MKIYSNAADNFVKDLKPSTVLIYGNDAGGVRMLAKKIIKRFLAGEDEQESVCVISPEQLKENENIVLDEINSKGFFSPKKLVWLDLPPDSVATQLEEALKATDSSTFLLITGGELKKESKLRKFYEDSKQHTALLCYKEDGANLKRYIGGWLVAHKIQVDMDALEFLSANLGEDKLITDNELEKLALYLGDERRLTLDDVTATLADNSELAVSDIMYAISCKTPALLEKSLARAFADNIAAVIITRSMIYHFNRLLSAKLMIQSGMGVDAVVEAQRMFFKLKEPFKTSLRKWNVEALQTALKTATKLELEVKSNYGDQEMIVRDSLLKLAA